MPRSYSSLIPSEQIQEVTDWDFGAVDLAALKFAAKLKAQAEEEERARNSTAHQEGYNEGYAAGFAQGHAQATLEGQRQMEAYIGGQGQEAARAFLQLFETTQTQLLEAEQMMADGLLKLACELARQVLRAELSMNERAVEPVVREAMGLLVADSKAALIRLNPLDAEVFSEVLQKEFGNLTLTLLPDPSVTRGGCLVESAGTVVDGTLERRWQRAVARLGLSSEWDGGDEPA